MKLVGVLTLASCGLTVASAGAAQSSYRTNGRGINTAPRLMVATPVVVVPADSAYAVEVGNATRTSVQELVGDDFNVITQDQMNGALKESGFPNDLILSEPRAVDLAATLGARVVITSTLAKNETGQFAVIARLIGLNDPAGNIVAASQWPDDRAMDFGYRIAEALRPAIKSLSDAKTCMEYRETELVKATKGAEKAIKKIPNHGLAQFCLFLIAREQQKLPSQDQIKYLEAVVKADSLSMVSWKALANEYGVAGDTAKALATAKRILELTPNDKEVRNSVIRYTLGANQHKQALELIEEGLRSDPDNVVMLNQKAHVCLQIDDYECSIDALEMIYAVDSTKADSLFFLRLVGAAFAANDTARWVRWGQVGASQHPDNLPLLSQLNQAYSATGQVDSSISVTFQIIARDATAVRPALVALGTLSQADPMSDKAIQLINFVKQNGDSAAKEQLAHIAIYVAARRLKSDTTIGKQPDLAGGVEYAQLAIEVSDTASEVYYQANLYLGTALLQQANDLDPQTEAEKSCDKAEQEHKLVLDAKTALLKAAKSERYKPRTEPYLEAVTMFTPRTTAMLKAYCR